MAITNNKHLLEFFFSNTEDSDDIDMDDNNDDDYEDDDDEKYDEQQFKIANVLGTKGQGAKKNANGQYLDQGE